MRGLRFRALGCAILVNGLVIGSVFAQQGGTPSGGGFGGGGFGGGGGFSGGLQGGLAQQDYDRSIKGIETAISTYFNPDEIKNVLTPGEYSEWPLNLKAGQVVIADARSEAFDPALEVVDGQGEGNHLVLASNDDRYPGDQRPLLIWRCSKDGAYAIRARCFHDKSGGQFFLRLHVYGSLDVFPGKALETVLEQESSILLRLSMKAGQIEQLQFELPDRSFVRPTIVRTISPTGLPDIGLANRVGGVFENAIIAPVDGDYYVLIAAYSVSINKVRVLAKEIVPKTLTPLNGAYSAKAAQNEPSLWSISLKAGDLLEASTPGLEFTSNLKVTVAPEIARYDLKKPETNPFFPNPKSKEGEDSMDSQFEELPAIARDARTAVFVAKKDVVIWLATTGLGGSKNGYSIQIRPASTDFPADKDLQGSLKIGSHDYRTFDAKAGDVITFHSAAATFAATLEVRDPELEQALGVEFLPDRTTGDWNFIVAKPGRYITCISAIGDGGSGTYSLSRKVLHPKEFGKGTAAKGDFSTAKVEVWKFSVKPDEPILVHWKSSNWNYAISICDEQGHPATIGQTGVNGQHRYGILNVQKTATFVLVLTSNGEKSDYLIELSDLPGYGKEK